METLCSRTPSPSSPLFRTNVRQHGSSSTSFPHLIKNQSPCITTAILTNPAAEVISIKPSKLPLSPFKTTPQELKIVAPETLQYDSGFLGAVPDKLVEGEGSSDDIHDAMSYLTKILTSKVYDVAIESPLDYASKLSDKLHVNIWLKREDLQPIFSFKIRGAYNMMAKLSTKQLAMGVICSSAGNHAQGVALSAQKLGCTAVIIMPITTPEIKWKTVEKLGGQVVLVGDSYDEAQAYAQQRAKDEGLIFVHPFDHPDVIAGQGTIGMEILRQIQGPLHAIFVPVGGGGLIAGIASYVKRVRPEVKIIGVEVSDANAMALSIHHGQRIMLEKVGGFADGIAVKKVGEETFRLCRELIDGVVLVSRDAVCASIKDMFEEKRSILEPAGAVAIAGAEAYCKYYGLKGENVVAISSGANMNFDRLRLVSQLADVGRRCEVFLATFVPEKRGSFKQFCELVGPMNILEISYRYDDKKESGLVLYSVGFQTVLELEEMLDRMMSAQLLTVNLTNKELVKDHMQFLVGGRSSSIENEILCQFAIPARPGALLKFLDAFSPLWNISLFHYSGQGESGADALVGLHVASSEINKFKALADALGFNYNFETNNETLQLLLH
ncbi:threonine dehydratase biosynthetic, chloroplastic isoform X2 [Pyrus x bretschneideri]|uniref:threonine dehydratase biosynthetic, chloroplastic isoform X2 n=1 Tax=Pyrus x bretschneideri TaxID=225117 RepID=UPI00202FEB82|nr:threonine dehydratase biosynthetic, chloroplastic isoform X2 [Pyrus x bretschneideri]